MEDMRPRDEKGVQKIIGNYETTGNKSASATGLCGCGKQGQYFIKGEMACNKWHRCLTYDELAEQVIELKVALFKIKGIIDETPA